jgi:hypothetical protein
MAANDSEQHYCPRCESPEVVEVMLEERQVKACRYCWYQRGRYQPLDQHVPDEECEEEDLW